MTGAIVRSIASMRLRGASALPDPPRTWAFRLPLPGCNPLPGKLHGKQLLLSALSVRLRAAAGCCCVLG